MSCIAYTKKEVFKFFMYLVGSTPDKSRIFLISNKYKSVISQVYNLLNLTHELSLVDHLYPLYSFLKYLMSKNINFKLIKNLKELDYKLDAYIAFDISSSDIDLIKNIRKESSDCKLILAIAEHPAYQVSNLEEIANNFDIVLSAYKISSNTTKTYFPYIFDHLPSYNINVNNKLPKIESLNNTIDSTLIYSNLYSVSRSNYGLRRHAINTLSLIKDINFKWFGRGWKLPLRNYMKRSSLRYIRASLLQFPKLNSTAKQSYGGILKDKTLLYNVKSTLAIENFPTPSGYFTEKFTEPLLYGCIPIYLGSSFPKEIKEYIPKINCSNVFCDSLSDAISLTLELSKISIKETKLISESIRNNINTFINNSSEKTNLLKSADIIMNIINK